MTYPTTANNRLLRKLLLATLLPGLAFGAARAATLTVAGNGPADHDTISAAIVAAAPGDTILVLPGVYAGAANLNLDFAGKDLTLIGQDGPAATIIDAGGAGRAFWFHSGETAASLLRGFTITGCDQGGPVRITNGSAPRVRSCVVRGNQVTGSGGGFFIANASPDIRDCTIVENTATEHGAGIVVSGGAPVLNGLVVVGNRAVGRGGGVWITAGAAPTFTSCTISTNRANTAGGAFDGGGVAVTGLTGVVFNRTIIWGNRGVASDDLLVAAGSFVQLNCSLVDSLGTGGTGAVTRDAATRSISPRFCAPDYTGASPWTDGEYTIAANSPAAPAHSACGQLLGALPVGCGDITVWTGGAGTADWADADNWSTGSLPGAGDIVQLGRGNVFIHADASAQAIYQCSEDSSPDTLTVTGGAVLSLGASALFAKLDPDRSIKTEIVKVLDGEILFPCPDHCPGGSGPPTGTGYWILDLATIRGVATFINRGTIIVVPGGDVLFAMPIENVAVAGLGGGDLLIEGLATFAEPFLNAGSVAVAPTGTLNVSSTFTNAAAGVMELAGDLTGTGNLANEGTVLRVGPGSSQFNLAATNVRDLDLGQPGEINVMNGVLQGLAPFQNDGLVTVADGASLALDAIIYNGHAGVIALTGDLTGSGSLQNTGMVERLGPGVSVISQSMVNAVDPVTGEMGALLISAGTAQLAGLSNAGLVTVAQGATLQMNAPAVNQATGVLSGSGVVDVTATTLTNLGSLAPGRSPGILRIDGAYTATPASRLEVEITGYQAGTGYDQLRVAGQADLTGTLVVRVDDTFQYVVGDTFTIARVTPGVGSGALTANFTCLAGTRLPGRPALTPLVTQDRVMLVASAVVPTNAAPSAGDDSVTVANDMPAVLTVLANDVDPEGSPLAVAWLSTAPQHGRVVIDAAGSVVTYYPMADGAVSDQFVYVMSDCAGAIDSAQVFINLVDVSSAPPPPLSVGMAVLHPGAPNPFNPATIIRYELARPGPARLTIHDLRGGLVAVLREEFHEAGAHRSTWRGMDDSGRQVPSGAYFVRLEYASEAWTRKLLLLR